MEAKIRQVSLDDAVQIQAIYSPYVRSSSISFEVDEPTIQEVRNRIEAISVHYPWLVASLPEGILGYAYASRHRERAAYQWDVEVSVYVEQSFQRQGIGTLLYTVLLKVLKDLGYYNAYAGITLPNERSVRLHERLGFRKVGVFTKVGYKLDGWHDVGWWELELHEKDTPKRRPFDITSWIEAKNEKELLEYGMSS